MSQNKQAASSLYISYKKPRSSHRCGEYDLSDHQWEKIRTQKIYQETPSMRVVELAGLSRTLRSSYHHSYLMYSQFIPWQAGSTPTISTLDLAAECSVVAHRNPRFFTPRECCRLQGTMHTLYRLQGSPCSPYVTHKLLRVYPLSHKVLRAYTMLPFSSTLRFVTHGPRHA